MTDEKWTYEWKSEAEKDHILESWIGGWQVVPEDEMPDLPVEWLVPHEGLVLMRRDARVTAAARKFTSRQLTNQLNVAMDHLVSATTVNGFIPFARISRRVWPHGEDTTDFEIKLRRFDRDDS